MKQLKFAGLFSIRRKKARQRGTPGAFGGKKRKDNKVAKRMALLNKRFKL